MGAASTDLGLASAGRTLEGHEHRTSDRRRLRSIAAAMDADRGGWVSVDGADRALARLRILLERWRISVVSRWRGW